MSSDEIVIDVKNLSKRYEIYATPRDRLKQLVFPSIYRIFARITGLFGRASDHPQPQYFREFWALHNVSFQVRKGETLGIVGRNGSGKSTLLQLICSTLTQTSGDVAVKGRISALLELGSGFNPDYTGRENVFLNGQILGLSQKDIETRYESIVEFADIGVFIDQPVKTYSSGMTVRLAFAVAINVDPEILVIDEALAVGDVGFQARCFAKINELRQRGVTLLFVSHSHGAVTELCNRAILIDGGELLLQGTPNQVIRAYNLLASAGKANFNDVRKEVVALAEVENATLTASNHVSTLNTPVILKSEPKKLEGHKVALKTPTADSMKDTASLEAYFDQKLHDAIKPLPFERRGAEISNVCVVDMGGQLVNVLPMHQEYMLKFDVRFDEDFEHVRFAWVIKTVSGTTLGGGTTHQPGCGISLGSSTRLQVTSHFVNCFLPGNYIIGVGVRGKIDADDEFIHGISSAVTFQSIFYGINLCRGMVDCLVYPSFKLMDSDGHAIMVCA